MDNIPIQIGEYLKSISFLISAFIPFIYAFYALFRNYKKKQKQLNKRKLFCENIVCKHCLKALFMGKIRNYYHSTYIKSLIKKFIESIIHKKLLTKSKIDRLNIFINKEYLLNIVLIYQHRFINERLNSIWSINNVVKGPDYNYYSELWPLLREEIVENNYSNLLTFLFDLGLLTNDLFNKLIHDNKNLTEYVENIKPDFVNFCNFIIDEYNNYNNKEFILKILNSGEVDLINKYNSIYLKKENEINENKDEKIKDPLELFKK